MTSTFVNRRPPHYRAYNEGALLLRPSVLVPIKSLSQDLGPFSTTAWKDVAVLALSPWTRKKKRKYMSDRKAFFEHLRMKDLFWNAFRSVSFSLMPYLNRYMKELLEELEVTTEMISD